MVIKGLESGEKLKRSGIVTWNRGEKGIKIKKVGRSHSHQISKEICVNYIIRAYQVSTEILPCSLPQLVSSKNHRQPFYKINI